MKRIAATALTIYLITSPLESAGVLQSFSDSASKRSITKTLSGLMKIKGNDDSLFAAFAADYLLHPYNLTDSSIGDELQAAQSENEARAAACAKRQSTLPETVPAVFKAYRLPTERQYFPKYTLAELLKMLLATKKLLADSGEGTFAALKNKINEKYADETGTQKTENEQTDGATNAVTALQASLAAYLNSLTITAVDINALAIDQINTLINASNDFDQAIQAASEKNTFYTTLLAPQLESVLAGANPITADLAAEAKKYADFFKKIDATDFHALGAQLATTTGGLINQLVNASTILTERLNGSIVLNNKLIDIQETLFASGVLATQARIVASDIRAQCSKATTVLVQMLKNCYSRMTFDSGTDESAAESIMNMFTPLLSDGQCDAALLSNSSACQTLRNIATYVKEDAAFYKTYSDNYAFPKKGKRLWAPRFGKSEMDIIGATIDKFETDTQRQNPKTPTIASPQASVATCIQYIPDIAGTNEIGFLANQLGFYSLLATAFTTKAPFFYGVMVRTKFPYTDALDTGANPTADKWAPGSNPNTSNAEAVATEEGGGDEDDPAAANKEKKTLEPLYTITLAKQQCKLTVKDASDQAVSGITQIFSKATTADSEITIFLSIDGATFVQTNATKKAGDATHYEAKDIDMSKAANTVTPVGNNILVNDDAAADTPAAGDGGTGRPAAPEAGPSPAVADTATYPYKITIESKSYTLNVVDEAGQPITDITDIMAASGAKAGKTIQLILIKDGKELLMTAQQGDSPSSAYSIQRANFSTAGNAQATHNGYASILTTSQAT